MNIDIKKYCSLAMSIALTVALSGCGGGGSGDSLSNKNKEGVTSSYASSTNTKSSTKQTDTKDMESLAKTDSEYSLNGDTNNNKIYYILHKKSIQFQDHNETTLYDLNQSSPSYIAYSKMTSTTGDEIEKKYDFNTTSKTLNVYVKNIIGEWELTQRAKFKKGAVKDIVDFKNGDNNYMINTFDPLFFAGYRVIENIKDIEKGLFNVQTFNYDEDGAIKSITAGYLDSLDDENMTVESKNVLETNVSKPAVNPVFSDDNMTVRVGGNAVYEFVKFDNSGKE